MAKSRRKKLIGIFESALPATTVVGSLTEASPLEFRHHGELVTAFLVRPSSTPTWVLAIEVDVATVEETIEVLRYVASHSVSTLASLYAAAAETSSAELELQVWHTLIADTVTRDGLAEILDSVSVAARDHRANIEELVADAPAFPSDRRDPRGREEIMQELASLVGMSSVREEIIGVVKGARVAQERIRHGLVGEDPSPNLVFVGNPGTGKTTVARLVAELYGAIGVLPVGHLVETNRGGLVGEYIGQTAIKTQNVCEEALGGVLFIDEAYSLTPEHKRDFGAEAIAALIQFMENHRGELAIIVAGYPEEMERFLEANPGLRSRFDITVPFPDYSDDELEQIFLALAELKQYDLTPAALERLRATIAKMERGRGFGNAREMRKLFESVVRRQALDFDHPSCVGTDILRRIDALAFPPERLLRSRRDYPGYL